MEISNELYLFDLEKGVVIGVDEAGRGPLAGPVVAAAAILKPIKELNLKKIYEINDSKKLSEKKREELFEIINENFIVGIGIATHLEIDEINILNGTFLAMKRALESLKEKGIKVEEVKILVDGNHKIKNLNLIQEPIIKGDGKSISIAAASIIAKVTRDRIMEKYIEKYPCFNFKKHKGYGTKQHREEILKNGPSEIHRKTFLKKILMNEEKK